MKRKRRRSELDRVAVRLRRLYAKRGARCWPRALELIARASVDEIIIRMGVALRVALNGGGGMGRELARDGYLFAGARLWWYRSIKRDGDAARDLLDDLNRAWAAIATGPHDDAWYKARLEASAFYLVACGLPQELIPAVTEMAEQGLKAHDD